MEIHEQNFGDRLKKVEDYQSRQIEHDINLNQKIDKLDNKVDNLKIEMNQRFDKVESEISEIKKTLDRIEQKIPPVAGGFLKI